MPSPGPTKLPVTPQFNKAATAPPKPPTPTAPRPTPPANVKTLQGPGGGRKPTSNLPAPPPIKKAATQQSPALTAKRAFAKKAAMPGGTGPTKKLTPTFNKAAGLTPTFNHAARKK